MSPPTGQGYCSDPGSCNWGWLEVGCNGSNDCPAPEICCGRYNNQVGYMELACSPTCEDSGQSFGIVMCGDDPDSCPSGQTCQDSSSLPDGYAYCGN